MNIHISITQDDIDKGKKNSACWCPVALAIRREIPEVDQRNVVVAISMTYIIGYPYYAASNPPIVHNFIMDYDNDKSVKPFEADLSFNVCYDSDKDV